MAGWSAAPLRVIILGLLLVLILVAGHGGVLVPLVEGLLVAAEADLAREVARALGAEERLDASVLGRMRDQLVCPLKRLAAQLALDAALLAHELVDLGVNVPSADIAKDARLQL